MHPNDLFSTFFFLMYLAVLATNSQVMCNWVCACVCCVGVALRGCVWLGVRGVSTHTAIQLFNNASFPCAPNDKYLSVSDYLPFVCLSVFVYMRWSVCLYGCKISQYSAMNILFWIISKHFHALLQIWKLAYFDFQKNRSNKDPEMNLVFWRTSKLESYTICSKILRIINENMSDIEQAT